MNYNWKNWKWQQRNAVRNVRELADHFTHIDKEYFDDLHEKSKNFRFQVTPYMLSQIPPEVSKEDLKRNPWFLQKKNCR